MGRINRANLKKTIYYLRRNGIRRTLYAVLERLDERKQPPYVWDPPSEAKLKAQRTGWQREGLEARFSILVPAYRTKPEYLRELVESLRCQTYPGWELILADATEDDSVEQVLRPYLEPGETDFGCSRQGAGDVSGAPGAEGSEAADMGRHSRRDLEAEFSSGRIRYIHLERNAGIAGNTNQGLPYATGDYIGLLDHDDILTPDALYEMAAAIREAEGRGERPRMLYSDEDKCNGDRTAYFELNRKEDFNLDLLLSNNYICHFLVMERELMQGLGFRPEYNGAQDYDLVLRAAACLKGREQSILHIPRVLYHWRCHTGSTAENPQSKRYAYEAGRRALQDFARSQGWRAEAADTAHVGFYALCYEGDIFDSRTDLGAVGGRLVRRGRIVGGRMDRHGQVLYEGLPADYSGYLHRAVLAQSAEAVDLRNIRIRPECRDIFRRVTGILYRTVPGTDIFDASLLPEGCDVCRLSLELCRAIREEGYGILYLPDMTGKG